jgi:hypothetical protein
LDKKFGYGEYWIKDKLIYKGDWKDDKMDGKGIINGDK